MSIPIPAPAPAPEPEKCEPQAEPQAEPEPEAVSVDSTDNSATRVRAGSTFPSLGDMLQPLPIACVGGMIMLTCITVGPEDAPLSPALAFTRSLGLMIFGTFSVLRWILVLAWAAHAGEALVATRQCVRAGLSLPATLAWTAVVFASGGPMLRHALKLPVASSDKKQA